MLFPVNNIMNKFIVYRIRNLQIGKCYVGLTSQTLNNRWGGHVSSAKNGSLFRFHSAIRKYGTDSWKLEIISENLQEIEARKKERDIISIENLTTCGYNAKPGGCGGWIVSDEKYTEWKKKKDRLSKGFSNPNASNLKDDEIADLVYEYYKLRKIYGDFSIRSALINLNKSNGVPLQLKKDFRFVDYGGGTIGLVKYLIDNYGLSDDDLKYKKTDLHKKILSEQNKKIRWYTNRNDKKPIRVKEDNWNLFDTDDNWIRGRKI